MAIYLVQHGKNLPKDIDPEKGLSEDGIADVTRIAEVAAGYHCRVDRIIHSGLKRAEQSAEIFAAQLKPAQGVEMVSGMQPLDDVEVFSQQLSAEENLMVVGHLPFMSKLTSWLLLGSVTPPVFKFQNGGIVCLDREGDSESWIIKWTLMPDIS